MRKKLIITLLSLILILQFNITYLFAQESEPAKDPLLTLMKPIVFPCLSIRGGIPDPFSVDAGVNVYFLTPPTIEFIVAFGVYTKYSYAKNNDNNFHRFSGGVSLECLGLMGCKAGAGYGLMPRNGERLSTWFIELTGRLFILDLKFMYEFPVSNNELKAYYQENFKPFKFNIGIGFF